jgi:hypothetical protein
MRLLGLGAVIGGVLFLIYEIGLAAAPSGFSAAPALWATLYLVGLVAAFFQLLGIIGIYALQANKAAEPGLGVFVLTILGSVAFMAFAWGGAMIYPAIFVYAPDFLSTPSEVWQFANSFVISHFLYAVGVLLFGMMTWWADLVPRRAAGLIVLGGLLGVSELWLPDLWGAGIVIGVGFAWIGGWMWRSKKEEG